LKLKQFHLLKLYFNFYLKECLKVKIYFLPKNHVCLGKQLLRKLE
jgi:hypothetical protein